MNTTLLALGLTAVTSIAQVQTAWIRTYHNDLTGKTSQPVAVKLDAAGNIIMAGTSQNSAGDSDYVVLKYAPDGTKLFVARYSSGPGADDTAKGFAVDAIGNSFVTGTGGTVKIEANGNLAWTVPYAGRDVVVDTYGSSYITGFSAEDFATVKLNPDGSNVWVRIHDQAGMRDESQKVAVGKNGNVYVAGWVTTYALKEHSYKAMVMLSYTAAGFPVLTNTLGSDLSSGEVEGLFVEDSGNVTVTANQPRDLMGYLTLRFGPNGSRLWTIWSGPPGVRSMIVEEASGAVFLTGGRYSGLAYGTFKLTPAGDISWERRYFGSTPSSHNEAFGICLTRHGSVVVTGLSSNSVSRYDIATVAYDTQSSHRDQGGSENRERWVKHFNGPANGNDGGVAVTVAPDDSIYVAGYSATAEGGTEMVLIKYVEPRVHATPKTSGDVQIEMNGVPGSRYAFQSSGDLQTWLSLSTNTADATGQATFTDTNASNLHPFRFYRSLLLP